MRTLFVALAGATAVLAADVASVQAQVSSPRNPWCIRDGVNGAGSWDCSYHNLAQCRASASGAGGHCVRNPNYRGGR
jgi:hypothetical protein